LKDQSPGSVECVIVRQCQIDGLIQTNQSRSLPGTHLNCQQHEDRQNGERQKLLEAHGNHIKTIESAGHIPVRLKRLGASYVQCEFQNPAYNLLDRPASLAKTQPHRLAIGPIERLRAF